MKKLLLVLGVFASIIFASSVSAALIYVNDNGFYPGNELSSEVQYDLEGANLSFTININIFKTHPTLQYGIP
jgi:hypothetical protein